MGCINRVELSGNLTSSPEIKATQSGGVMAKFAIAQNRRKADGTERAQFVECVKFMGQNPSQAMQKFWESLEKGRRVFVAGQLRVESYEKDGERRKSAYVAVDELDTVGRPSADPSSYAPGQQMPIAAAPTQAPAMPQAEVYDEDIPFD